MARRVTAFRGLFRSGRDGLSRGFMRHLRGGPAHAFNSEISTTSRSPLGSLYLPCSTPSFPSPPTTPPPHHQLPPESPHNPPRAPPPAALTAGTSGFSPWAQVPACGSWMSPSHLAHPLHLTSSTPGPPYRRPSPPLPGGTLLSSPLSQLHSKTLRLLSAQVPSPSGPGEPSPAPT